MLAKILVHAGLSKCGSTSLQWQLAQDADWLHSRGTALCVEEFPVGASFHDALTLEEWRLSIARSPCVNGSLARTFQQYKRLRGVGDDSAAGQILERLAHLADDALETCDQVVFSAEAFETSLALRDPLFADVLERLEHIAQTHVVVYVPRPSEHMVGSWQEWGWRDGYRLAEWLELYSRSTSAESFWSGQVDDYWTHLFRMDVWIPWWSERLPRPLDVRVRASLPEKDVVKDFYETMLGLRPPAWQPRQNSSWPAWALPMLRSLGPTFHLDYERFDRARRLLGKTCPEVFGMVPRDISELTSVVEDFVATRLLGDMIDAAGVLDLPVSSLVRPPAQRSEAELLTDLATWDTLVDQSVQDILGQMLYLTLGDS